MTTSENSKACALLAYIFPIGLLWYLIEDSMKKDSFARFHVYQGLSLFISWAIAFVAVVFLSIISFGVLAFLGILVNIALLVFVIIGIINVTRDEKKELPFVGGFAKKFNF